MALFFVPGLMFMCCRGFLSGIKNGEVMGNSILDIIHCVYVMGGVVYSSMNIMKGLWVSATDYFNRECRSLKVPVLGPE